MFTGWNLCKTRAVDLDDDLTQPLWKVLSRGVVRYVGLNGVIDRWSHLSRADRAERRAGWPTSRRAVRPVGLAVFWAGVIWSVIGNDHTTTMTVTIRILWILLLTPFAYIGIADWVRDGKDQRRSTKQSAPSVIS